MKTVDKLTDQDVVSQLLTVDHATEATTVNKIPQANLSEKLKETKPTSSNRDNISPQALQDHYHSNDVPKLNDVHCGTHRDFSNIPIAERQALQDLYESTDGTHWNYSSSSSAGTHWSFDDPDVNPCVEGWYGVQCVDNHITGLSLAGIHMIGTIPESLSQLTMLMHLDLGGNLLIGRVPTTLCQIKSLVRVDLEGNSIACYPHCLEHTAIEVKVHPSTRVCNNIPSSPYSISGPSKDASSSSALVKTSSHNSNNISPLERQALQDLYDSTGGPNWFYDYDYLRMPWNFSNSNANPCDERWYGVICSIDYHVKDLSLYSNNLIGSIPSTIGQLSSLQYRFLYGNQLIGTIPLTIGQLSSLQHLYLYSNQLTGTIPSTIGQLSSLQHLYLYINQLTGSIPSTIGQLYSLQDLYLFNNLLIGTIPSTIGQLSSLQWLDLFNNLLTGSIPSTIGQLTSLENLYLYSNQLTGVVPTSLCQLYLTVTVLS